MMRSTLQSGFTLVEMLVAVAIFAIISSVLLANYPEFRSRAALDNMAHQVALEFREAQVFGISVRGQAIQGQEAQTAFNSYGVYIGEALPSTGLPELIVFGDKNNDKIYDSRASETLTTFRLTSGENISQVCTNVNITNYRSDIGLNCNVAGATQRTEPIVVMFTRPSPSAVFYNGNGEVIDRVQSVTLELSNRAGNYKRAIQIFSTGQIVVK